MDGDLGRPAGCRYGMVFYSRRAGIGRRRRTDGGIFCDVFRRAVGAGRSGQCHIGTELWTGTNDTASGSLKQSKTDQWYVKRGT